MWPVVVFVLQVMTTDQQDNNNNNKTPIALHQAAVFQVDCGNPSCRHDSGVG